MENQKVHNYEIQETRLLDTVLKLVQIDSESRNERAVADYLKDKLETLGYTVKEDNAGAHIGGNAGNVIAYHERVMGEESLKKMQYRTKLSLMGILLDINHPFVVAFLLLFFVGVRKIIKGVILGDKVLVNNMLRAIAAILSDVDTILQYRKISRSIGAYL